MINLHDLGFSDFFQRQIDADDSRGLHPARVVKLAANECGVLTPEGELVAHLPGRLATTTPAVVGDWVLVDTSAEPPTIVQVLERKTSIMRQSSGRRSHAQIIVSNVDLVFIVTGLGHDFNLRRIERYLAMVHDSGARPVLLLTKAGLCANVDHELARARSVAPGVDVHAIDVVAGIQADIPATYLAPGVTGALVGSSGVGKSTLLNHLLDEQHMATAAIRVSDGRGRHTTTHREMFFLPAGGALIDNPGTRELALWLEHDGLSQAFSDVSDLAEGCRFNDCTHKHEPGCAVVTAAEAGKLEPARLDSFHRLQSEAEDGERRRSVAERRGHERRGSKLIREVVKLKKQRR